MIQEAILLTKTNVPVVADSLSEYTAEELLAEYQSMLDTFNTLVLCRSVLSDFACVSFVVTESMFDANNPHIPLNDKTFTKVREI